MNDDVQLTIDNINLKMSQVRDNAKNIPMGNTVKFPDGTIIAREDLLVYLNEYFYLTHQALKKWALDEMLKPENADIKLNEPDYSRYKIGMFNEAQIRPKPSVDELLAQARAMQEVEVSEDAFGKGIVRDIRMINTLEEQHVREHHGVILEKVQQMKSVVTGVPMMKKSESTYIPTDVPKEEPKQAPIENDIQHRLMEEARQRVSNLEHTSYIPPIDDSPVIEEGNRPLTNEEAYEKFGDRIVGYNFSRTISDEDYKNQWETAGYEVYTVQDKEGNVMSMAVKPTEHVMVNGRAA